MNILLVAVNAKYIHSNLAVYNLRACAKEYQSQIQLLEYTINEYAPNILRDICKRKPDFLAVSCYIWNIALVEELLEDFHQIYEDTPIWLGGPEVSYESRSFLVNHPFVTGVMLGEGEETFYELLCAYDCEKEVRERQFENELEQRLEHVAGLIFRKENGIIMQTGSRACMDLNQIPLMLPEDYDHKIIYYESSRGCPFSCSYCLSSVDKKLRFRDLELVKQDLLFFIKRELAQVKFVDRTFNCNRERAREIWRFLLENDEGHTNFHFEVSADLFEEEDFALFEQMRPGLIQLEIGLQSINPDTLREIRRVTDLERLKRAVLRVNNMQNIHQHLDLIAGLPFEDYESFQHSFKEAFEMKPDQLQLGFLKILKGSYMYEKVQDYGILFSRRPPYEALETKWLSFEKISQLKSVEEMVETYYNSMQFLHTLTAALQHYVNPFDLFYELALFYEEKGLDSVSHSRMARYDLFRDFLMMKFPEEISMYTELLVYDFYARENAKSRPSWALDLTPYKDGFYQFYKIEEKTHQYLSAYQGYSARQLSKMTHLEAFLHQGEEPFALLFDYQQRNPKNKQARTVKIKLPERKENE